MGLARYAGQKWGGYKQRREVKRKESQFYRDQAREAHASEKGRMQRKAAKDREAYARQKGRYIAQHGTLGWIRHKAKLKRQQMAKKRRAQHHRRR